MALTPDEMREYKREWARKNYDPEKARERNQKWRTVNPEKSREASCESQRKRRAENPEKAREANRKWLLANPERRLEHSRKAGAKWRAGNPDKVRSKHAAYHETNAEAIKVKNAAYRQTARGKALHRSCEAHRRALKSAACPAWVDRKAIEEIYADCPEGYHVDHIHPLKGKHSTGLHVPWNLQYLPDTENSSKSNQMPQPGYFDWFSEAWTIHAPTTGRVWTPTNPEDE